MSLIGYIYHQHRHVPDTNAYRLPLRV